MRCGGIVLFKMEFQRPTVIFLVWFCYEFVMKSGVIFSAFVMKNSYTPKMKGLLW